jgi:hypothetical protein
MGGPGRGRGRRHVPWPPLLGHRPRAKRDGGWHWGPHALGCLETLQAGLAEVFGLGNRADRVQVRRDIPGHTRAMAPPASFQVHTRGGVADGADALGAVRALPGEALGLVTRGVHRLGALLQAGDALRRTARAPLGTHVMRHVAGRVPLLERRCGLGDRLGGRPLCGGHRA